MIKIECLSPDILKNANPGQLYAAREILESALATIKNEITKIDDELSFNFKEKASAAYTSNNKSSGKLTVETYVNALTQIKITADISKKVEWNSTLLRNLYGTLPIDFAKLFIDVKFNVSEANYPKLKEALPAQEKLLELPENILVNFLEQSRVVKYGSPKIALEKISA